MARYASPASFASQVKKWMAQRMKYVALRDRYHKLIEEIDHVFHGIGGSISNGHTGKRRGRPPGSGKAAGAGRGGRRRKRGRFAISGEQSVLDFVKKHGNPSTAEVNKHWQGEGRGGKADNTLTRLVQSKQLKRVAAKDARGSRYETV